ncbi:nuclease S1 precursor, putative [Talaromyces stipitatus ATCC 10500]|uniref:Nuclease S1, putative n=1 Tax=Talaromyces stipitatus (strain ATCC 10500 / CBS 375.48 / QM 6759 / NRRL 1006) TaxID=441959 RepID=B8M7Q2_TALSN|nr:nuclease S1 precursor, putative [Talaromyces stipitatus ATCC 10500]EED19605.1 nuclease S1 precursor, putative [Talaromyces stipitatus ATCC 10500]
MMPANIPASLIFATQIYSAYAWGNLGHETVAYIAQNFVKSSTESYFQDLLGDSSSSYLASVSTWADTYKHTSEGSFSRPFHYIDAHDDPPTTCNVDYNRDCGDSGCLVSAIENYTNILLEKDHSTPQAVDALKFIVHFLGDIHQPLHDESLDKGGNGINVTYKRAHTNLHHIWDTNMPEEDAGGHSLSTAQSWASILTTRIKSGQYFSNSSSWLDGIDVGDPVNSAMTWARDANSYVCSTVLKPGLDYLEATDLSSSYYSNSKPVFEELIARAGYRLAAWLDAIVLKNA